MLFPFLLLLFPLLHAGDSSRILALFPYPLKSHFIAFDALLVELANRGHDVTVVTSFPKSYKIANYSEIDASHCLQMPKGLFELEYAASQYKSAFHLVHELIIVTELHEYLLKCQTLQDLMYTEEKYDLLITEAFCSDALLPFAHVLDTPFILFSSLPMLPWLSDRVGNIDNPSYIPFPFSDFPLTRDSTYLHRLYNTAIYLMARGYHRFIWQPRTNQLAQKYFGADIPAVEEIAKRTSMIFSFSHFSMNSPRPLVPNVVEAGGIHIKPPRVLPQDLQQFMDEATDGVIYFCLGSLLQAETMPEYVRDAFLKAFSKLPQRVLWKWENEVLPGKTDNVMIKKWMPQRDVLAHPNIKLFIAHGGALGLNEAVYEGVPIIGIPFYGDQKLNVKVIQSAGAGEILWYEDISAEKISQKVNTVLNDTSYKENALKLSSIFKDRPMSPMETAVYWTEYVIRHDGAYHLKPASTRLRWDQYLLLDVLACLLVVFLLLIYFIKISIWLLSFFGTVAKLFHNIPERAAYVSKKTQDFAAWIAYYVSQFSKVIHWIVLIFTKTFQMIEWARSFFQPKEKIN